MLEAGAAGPDGQPLFVDFVNTLHWYEGAPIELIGTECRPRHLARRARLARRDDVSAACPTLHRLREHVRAITKALASAGSRPRRTWPRFTRRCHPAGHLTLRDRDTGSALGLATDAPDTDARRVSARAVAG